MKDRTLKLVHIFMCFERSDQLSLCRYTIECVCCSDQTREYFAATLDLLYINAAGQALHN